MGEPNGRLSRSCREGPYWMNGQEKTKIFIWMQLCREERANEEEHRSTQKKGSKVFLCDHMVVNNGVISIWWRKTRYVSSDKHGGVFIEMMNHSEVENQSIMRVTVLCLFSKFGAWFRQVMHVKVKID